MYGSSYPHWSTSSPEVMATDLQRLDAAQRDKVLWRNASELYGLTVPSEARPNKESVL
jgi:predicted TIM-barrel fold metal-dependent hydrolase